VTLNTPSTDSDGLNLEPYLPATTRSTLNCPSLAWCCLTREGLGRRPARRRPQRSCRPRFSRGGGLWARDPAVPARGRAEPDSIMNLTTRTTRGYATPGRSVHYSAGRSVAPPARAVELQPPICSRCCARGLMARSAFVEHNVVPFPPLTSHLLAARVPIADGTSSGRVDAIIVDVPHDDPHAAARSYRRNSRRTGRDGEQRRSNSADRRPDRSAYLRPRRRRIVLS